MKLTTRLFRSRRIILGAASFLSLACIAVAETPYANPFERSTPGDDWGILNNDVFFGGAYHLFGLSPASRTLLLTETTESKRASESNDLVNSAKSSESFSFASFVGSPFVSHSGMSALALVVPDNRLWIGTGSAIGWANSSNWDPADDPSTATEVAQFGTVTNTSNTVGIGGVSRLSGAIEMLSNRTANMTIAASGQTGSTLTLTLAGVTINGVDNTILRNNSSFDLTLMGTGAISGATNVLQLALGNTTDNVINIEGTGKIIIDVPITGSGKNLTLNATGTGYLEFNGGLGANTYSGLTLVNSGTLRLDKANGTNAIAGNIKIGNGTAGGTATVRLSNSNQFSNTSDVELAGGTLNLNGFSEGAPGTTGVGALTLTTTSTIDFGPGANSIIQFAGLGTQIDGQILQIINWDGVPVTGGSGDRLLFAGTPTDFTSLYNQNEVSFNGLFGYDVVDFGSFYEVTAIPEPGTWIGAALALAAIGFTQRKRFAERSRVIG